MGRGKIEIKRIENSTNRQVTFSKRRNGIIKKAREISVLCDAQVSVVIFSSSGKMSEYCSPSTTLPKLLRKYQQNSGKKLWDAKHENLSAEIDRIKKENDNMQIELRHMKGEDLNSLHPKELIPIEEALQNGLTVVRDKQARTLYHLRHGLFEDDEEEWEIVGGGEQAISFYAAPPRYAMNGNMREPQIPMGFRVQPIQPNLQEDK
uniref:MADS-box transcription factor 2 n=1 Tax=Ananas comosus var. bracteatus TaxID=296719 RepID=A0A6V7Q779_ANACO|nr:unnamed protein product [Ananas comosus var. bracteatus]